MADANLRFTVDTTPMARTVDSVKGHVNGVSAAVVTMEAAVIASERAASRTICENVDKGFYTLVKSQISQKAVAAYTEMTTKEMTLVQLTKALDNVKRQMEADYQMIARRYTKLFASLNKALEIRVQELDRPAMKLAEIKKSFLFDKLKNNGATMICAANDIVSVAETALGGKLKQKTKTTLQTLSTQVSQDDSYTKKVSAILLRDEGAGHDAFEFLPAIFFSGESSLHRDQYIDTVYTVQSDLLPNGAALVSAIDDAEEEMAWAPVKAEAKETLKKELLSLAEKDSLDERTTNELLRLFDRDNWLVMGGGGG
ncbi:MAG: hypothetical protein LBE17_03650 [Treponema sp.]|jgi:hypothetical protein|nr:hypothetical protein [Treponema sp.]